MTNHPSAFLGQHDRVFMSLFREALFPEALPFPETQGGTAALDHRQQQHDVQ